MELVEYNRDAWNKQVEKGNQWTKPVTEEVIANAKIGEWQVVLTPLKPVPHEWFGDLQGRKVLCLASGGGQQGPILSAVGAEVTVFDNSPKQLEQDQNVAKREGLGINTVQGDMRDLACFDTSSFDLVFNPCSINFVPEVQSVFNEVARVLKRGGRFLFGVTNPMRFIFDENKLEAGEAEVRHALPYSDESRLTEAEIQKLKDDDEPLMFSHSLEDLIAGQARAGLHLQDMFEDTSDGDYLSKYLPTYFATLSTKP